LAGRIWFLRDLAFPTAARFAHGAETYGEPRAKVRQTRSLSDMCRNIRPLHNYEPPATAEEAHDAALQYVRKISGTTKPSKANAEAFDRAVQAVTDATLQLLSELVTTAPPKNREVEAAKARARSAQRFAAA
jgi:hypothetical protein